MKIYPLSSSSDVLHEISNWAISRCRFADNGKEMNKNEKRMCRACKPIICFNYKERLRLYKRWPCSTYILNRVNFTLPSVQLQ